jgi:hypothetical protein
LAEFEIGALRPPSLGAPFLFTPVPASMFPLVIAHSFAGAKVLFAVLLYY